MNWRRDQYGVVWFDYGCMSAECYREFQQEHDLTLYEELPEWDNREQTVFGDLSNLGGAEK
jgi:hypothetical protein